MKNHRMMKMKTMMKNKQNDEEEDEDDEELVRHKLSCSPTRLHIQTFMRFFLF